MMRSTLGIVFAFMLGCSDGERTEPAASACDPFATSAEAITLGTVLGAGIDSNGTIYVVDQAPDGVELRAFAGSATTLVQQPVGGSGSSSDGSGVRRDLLTIDVLPRSYVLILEREGDETRMGRTFDVESRELGAVADLSPSDQLEIIDPDGLEGAEISAGQAEAEVQVEYFARLPGDELLLVTSLPDSADYYGSFRLFYGEPAALVERAILSMRRGRDGGSTTLEFELDGTVVTLSFPVEFDGMQLMPGAWTLELPDETIPLERLSIEADAELLEGAQLQCLG